MADKTEDKKENHAFSGSSELFEKIFKEATQEIQKEKGKYLAKPGLKPKPKPEAKPKAEVRPKAPIKLELEPKQGPESGVEPDRKPRSEAKPKIQSRTFKLTQEPIRKPITTTPSPAGGKKDARVVPVGPLVRGRVQEQKPKEETSRKPVKPRPVKKEGPGSPVIKIILLLVLLAVGIGGASIYLGIIDLSDDAGHPELATNEGTKVAATRSPKAQTAAKADQPAAPARAAQPQGQPADAPKPPVRSQTPQPPQVPPKQAEDLTPPPPKEATQAQGNPNPTVQPTASPPILKRPEEMPVTASSPSGGFPAPPVAQAKPATPTPPAKAKAETLTQTTQPQPKAEPRAAPVRSPVLKKVEIPQAEAQPKVIAGAKTVSPVSGSQAAYPYSVYLGSFQGPEYLKRAMSIYENQGFSPYWTKIDLGAKGIWHRVFTGYFRSAQEAEAFIQQRRIKEAEVKETKYSNLIGVFGTKQEGEQKILAFTRMGLSAYGIPAADGQVRVYSGAFAAKEDAEKNQAELNSRGIKSRIVER